MSTTVNATASTPPVSDRLHNVHVEAANALGELAKLFKPGMRLTFVARHPEHDQRHVIVTDDLGELAEMLRAEAERGK